MVTKNLSQKFDVIILGSGIAGSSLATILAKQKAKVLMIDKNSHPRFAIGEALTSHTEKLLSILSHQYSIPEFEHLSSFLKIKQNIPNTACGYKRSFGFLYHQKAQKQSSEARIQWGGGHSSHLYRQEIDSYLVETAKKYGSELLENTVVDDVNIDRNGVEVSINNGEQIRAEYIVDASGYNSVLAKKFDLREQPTRLKTQSRSIFTHMTGVKNADKCINITEKDILSWHQGTVHHIFNGGWMWVIPFDNHEGASNHLCSVGLNLDLKHFPRDKDLTPEQEFHQIVAQFPSINKQFKDAKPARNWIATDRLQYSSSACMGERYYLLPHSEGFIDPIFSMGLIQTFTTISPLAAIILQAIENNDFNRQHFAPLAKLQRDIFDYNDRIANCTYIAYRNFDLLNAWLRVWILQHMVSVSKIVCSNLFKLVLETYRSKDQKDLSQFAEIEYLSKIDPRTPGWGKDYVQKAVLEMEKVEQGTLTPEQAGRNILEIINSASWLFKGCGLADDSNRFMDIITSKRFSMSFIAYSLWSQWFFKQETRPYTFKVKDFIDVSRLKLEY